MNSKINKDTFCVLTHRGLHIDKQMNVKPCCVFKNFETPVIYDENMSILESVNTDQFKKLRQDLNSGIVHKGCSDCFNGRTNYRTDMNQLFETQSDVLNDYEVFNDLNTSEVNYIDLRISNKCNFKCIMCCDMYSSAWENDLKKIYPDYVAPSSVELSVNWKEDFKNISPSVKFIYFSGGEPFIMNETFELIELIEEDKKNISIFVNTNLSTLTYKDKFVLDYFKDFKKVVFHISCDGFGEIGEYIRFGFKSEKFKENLTNLLNFINEHSVKNHLSYDISYAISIINMYEIKSFLTTIKNELGVDDDKINFQTVGSPYNLSVSSLSKEEKLKITQNINSWKDQFSEITSNRLNTFLNTINTTQTEDFFNSDIDPELIGKVDEIRGNDINKFVPNNILKHLKIRRYLL